jgi:chloramphenicol 3-O-phosphotransferase
MSRRLILLSAACGVGKSTVKNALNDLNLLPDFACIDSDEVKLNWWTYKDTPREKDYTKDCLARAFELAGDKHLLFGTCNDPLSFFERITLPADVTARYIGMTCSDDEVRRRLLARPPERMCGEESFILSQIDYNGWIRSHAHLYDFFLDNTELTVAEAARLVASFAERKTV